MNEQETFFNSKSQLDEPYYSRNEQVEATINSVFQQTVEAEGEAIELGNLLYVFTGGPAYTFKLNSFYVSSDSFLKQTLETLPLSSSPLKILDVGSCDFCFVNINNKKYEGKIDSYGIAATHAFSRLNSDEIDDPHYATGNAEFLSTIYPEKNFHSIYSRTTFRHFSDPIGSLLEAYKALEPGGFLFVDEFKISGCSKYINQIIFHLKTSGYLIVATEKDGCIESLIIQKPENGEKNFLKFPVLFSGFNEGGQVIYEVIPEIKSSYHFECIEKTFYEEACRSILEESQQTIGDWLESIENLPMLFSDENYQELHNIQQLLCILAIISKNYRYESKDDLLNECCNEIAVYGAKMFIPKLFTNFPVEVLHHDKFALSFYSPKEKLKIITLAGMITIQKYGQEGHIARDLETLNIPYTKVTSSWAANKNRKLDFSDLRGLANDNPDTHDEESVNASMHKYSS